MKILPLIHVFPRELMDIEIHQNESSKLKDRSALLGRQKGVNSQEGGDEKSQEGSFEAD